MKPDVPSTESSPIREARTQLLREYLSATGYLTMDKGGCATWEEKGWTRRALEQAIEDLVVKGEAKVETFGMTLEVVSISKGSIT